MSPQTKLNLLFGVAVAVWSLVYVRLLDASLNRRLYLEEFSCTHDYVNVQKVYRFRMSAWPCRMYYDEWYYVETNGLGWDFVVNCYLFASVVPVQERRPLRCRDSYGEVTVL